MLQSLDTLIALVTYLSLCSIFVLIIVQMLSAALSLRGKSLANALALTFDSIDSTLTDGAGQRLAQKILSDPLLSDSVSADKSSDNSGPALLVVNQKFGGLMPKVNSFKLANAIRPAEVYEALKKLANGGDADAGALIAKIAGTSPKAEEITAKLKALSDIAAAVVDPATKAEILKGVGAASAEIVREIDSAKERFESWCQSAQDRAEQWFRTHTRGFTIGASIVFTCFCQIDGLELFKVMSTNSAAREAMGKAGQQLLADGSAWMDVSGAQETALMTAEEWNRQHGADVKIDATGIETKDQVRRNATAALTTAKTAAAEAVKDASTDAAKKPAAVAKVARITELEENFKSKFESVEETAHATFMSRMDERRKKIKAATDATGYPIFPDGRWWRWPGASTLGSFLNALCHLPGVALFAALLTLGAPYWFNLLKNLASLRPALAQLIGEEKKADAEKKAP
jgi:hypothetical protein